MISVRGRVPGAWNEGTASHITERLQAIERALSGGAQVFSTPVSPTFGPGSGVVASVAAGTVAPGGTTIVTNTTESAGWVQGFLLMGA